MRHLPLIALLLCSPLALRAGGGDHGASAHVECSRASGLIRLQLSSGRRIGRVVMQIADTNGRVLYREEGRAMRNELVRVLDKGLFPKGEAVLSVEARDMDITQRFTIE